MRVIIDLNKVGSKGYLRGENTESAVIVSNNGPEKKKKSTYIKKKKPQHYLFVVGFFCGVNDFKSNRLVT